MDYHPDDQEFWDDPGPEPDNFNWYAITIILAAVACGIIAWAMGWVA